MAHIVCTVSNCYFNKREGCTAPNLNVDGEKANESRFTCCETFIEQKPGVRSSVHEPKSETDIMCKAGNCVYNTNERCEASRVVVNGKNAQHSEETCCSTFKD
ncbi:MULTISPECIES: DUF1540 domain-containing protein [unclassified Sedimentibacter]|uniref:DUF1540 domain-containing protein n=1 Tax=unclassified Sedimentibacter TaxID=2649220 RepID=UPI0027DF3F71|nr:DUF1540 domain-containing protein [Sedimentibacter sp. MB35-C1]WMJ78132.1 DUF1540 domain-containing protein [Sedimentibacter sp. MB35-C1]